ncbi:MAG TPA: helix-turn-helix domain-containing protein [Vicinamibacteria bacterium]|jgi:DNA-binding NtrC family response regulator
MQQTTSLRSSGTTLKDRVDEYERGLINEALAATRGNQRQAAFQLGVLPTTLHEKMKRLGMIAPLGRRLRLAQAAIPQGDVSGESLAS